jgi:hypothetical protein
MHELYVIYLRIDLFVVSNMAFMQLIRHYLMK